MRIQSLITIVIAGFFLIFFDVHSGMSAILGGAVSVASSAAFAIIVSSKIGYIASDTVRLALRAEAVKIILTIGLLWVVFKFYASVNAIVFVGTFIFIVLIHSLALLVTDDTKKS
nr:ATP synthase subunit I [Nitrosomonas sp. JL21]